MRSDCKHVHVVDDNPRFAVEVWTWLSRRMRAGGFVKMATGGKPARSFAFSSRDDWEVLANGKCLTSHDGAWAVWWAEAMGRPPGDWPGRRAAPDVCILDQKGRDGYDPEQWALAWGKARSKADKLYHVSAYARGPGGGGAEVLPKNTETLESIFKLLVPQDVAPASPAVPPTGPHDLHVLVTGAGFEFADRVGGFGVRPTVELMASVIDHQWPPVACDSRWGHAGWCLPATVRSRGGPTIRWRPGSRDRWDLDEWWNRVLLANLPALAVGDGRIGDDLPGATGALERELELREAFRSNMVACDFGHLDAALHAARTPFAAWLSTNYTRFPERAFAEENAQVRATSMGPWIVLAAASEARRLRERLQHDPGGVARGAPRYHFKLHGDVARVDTMALAGLDKLDASPLLVKPDSLHLLYEAASELLVARLHAPRSPGPEKDPRKLVLHVVGQALADSLLRRLLRGVAQEAFRRGWAVELWRADPRQEAANCAAILALSEPGQAGLTVGSDTDLGDVEFLERIRLRSFVTVAPRYAACLRRRLTEPGAVALETIAKRVAKDTRLDSRDVEASG